MKKNIITSMLFGILFFSCSRSEIAGLEPDLVKPVIKIEYPLDIPVLPKGYPLCMKFLVKDNQSLATVWIEVNDGHGFRKEYIPFTRSMEVIEKYFAPDGVSGELLARFFATDQSGNSSSAEIRFVMDN